MSNKTKLLWKIFFVIAGFLLCFFGGCIGGCTVNKPRNYQYSSGDNSAVNVRIAESQSRINSLLDAIGERFESIDAILSGLPGQFTAIRTDINGLAKGIDSGLTTDRKLIQQLGSINSGINSLEIRIDAAQVGAGEISAIIDVIDAAAGKIGEANNP